MGNLKMKPVKLDEEVLREIEKRAVGLSDSPNKVLRRVFNLDKVIRKKLTKNEN
jgi:hypothetical protein